MTLVLDIVPGAFSVVRLPPGNAVPVWAEEGGSFTSITRTEAELSVVCESARVPEGVAPREDGWGALRVRGPLDFGLTGILSAVAAPLAAAGVPIFAVSTFDTDYVLVKQADMNAAIAALRAEGIAVESCGRS